MKGKFYKVNVSTLSIVAALCLFCVLWIPAVGGASSSESKAAEKLQIDPAKTAFLILHYQNDIVREKGKLAGPLWNRVKEGRNIENTLVALEASREKGILVIHVGCVTRPGVPEIPKSSPWHAFLKSTQCLMEGTWGAQFVDELKPAPQEPIVTHPSTNGFYGTDLDIILHAKDITTLVMAGIATARYVVLSTAFGASDRGYRSVILSDCCNDESDELHNWVLGNILNRIAIISDSKAYVESLQ